MKEFTGDDLRTFRKKTSMSRQDVAAHLNVSPVTVEKWEQHGDKPIKTKYYGSLSSIGALGTGVGAAGVAAGLIAAPAVLGVAAAVGASSILAGGLGLSKDSKDIQKLTNLLEGFSKLSPKEQKQYVNLLKKMSPK